jgi:hypothetical protein
MDRSSCKGREQHAQRLPRLGEGLDAIRRLRNHQDGFVERA